MIKELNEEMEFSSKSQIVLYRLDNSVSIEVKLDTNQDTVWLTQQQIADLFGTKRPAITKHLNNIFKSGELDKKSTCSILEHMGNDGTQKYSTVYYNLDAILSVGYRVNSVNATAFYTKGVGQGMVRLITEHDRFFPNSHIDIRRWRKESHDRWLIVDDQLYHCGHSLNANGEHKISAITLMGTSPDMVLREIE